MLFRHAAICALAALLTLSPAQAQAPATAAAPQAAPAAAAYALPDDVSTEHTIGEGENRLTYTATAGSLPLANDKGETTAKVFYVAYRVGTEPRPVTFVFNGGPGAAAAFLHLGALGPRVIEFTKDGGAPAEPVELRDNPDSWLPFTDLVFVDPVGTGFSRTVGSGEDKAYFGVNQDADAMSAFVQLYLTRNNRALAPVYIAGESYGGFRAALLANRLLRNGVPVKGAMLISPALEFSLLRGDEYALVPQALELPPLVAAQIELEGGPDAPQDKLREAETFARGDYLDHLMRGPKPDEAIVAKLAELTGLDPKVIARHHGRVSRSLFLQEYRLRTGRVLSVYDGAVTAPVPRPSGYGNPDPILDKAVSVLTPAMLQYTRDELGFKTDIPYKLLNREVSGNWDFGTTPNRQGFAGALDELQKARTLNPGLKVFVSHGYTDLVTQYTVSQFLIDQLAPIDTARPIDFRVYRGGHMMYMRAPSRAALTKDARAIYAE